MSVWTMNDVVDIIREGIPGADLSSIDMTSTVSVANSMINSVNGYVGVGGGYGGGGAGGAGYIPQNYENYVNLLFTAKLPLEKIGNVSIAHSDFITFFTQHCHPELNNLNNSTGYNSIKLNSQEVVIMVSLSLKVDTIAQTARLIRDSNFYSLLDATLES